MNYLVLIVVINIIVFISYQSINFLADVKESDLLMVNTCIVCHKPIEDLDSIDIRINSGKTCVENPEEHFHDKSYLRCSNPQCFSCMYLTYSFHIVFHKACVPDGTVNGRCGVCKIDPPPGDSTDSFS